ncbi:hypothetical protein [Limimaricola pyoseonensis]|uniref:Uncharacterized protein n=1 Tax=Limimaricola pyoseonensis TaxID=521013 RepID=A0A1G7GRK5_9RHOB|nr:hypothetical protein [Limimaricola pyoseonensis]SDE90599.1 hypothetical protein SAMN04488567_2889 [Limimaricola pyoseonensis]
MAERQRQPVDLAAVAAMVETAVTYALTPARSDDVRASLRARLREVLDRLGKPNDEPLAEPIELVRVQAGRVAHGVAGIRPEQADELLRRALLMLYAGRSDAAQQRFSGGL